MSARWLMRLVPFLLTVLISCLALWAWWRGEHEIARQVESRVEQEVSRLEASFRRAMRSQRATLMASQGLVVSQPMLSTTEWRLFHQNLMTPESQGGLRSVYFFQQVTDERLPRLVLQQRALHDGAFVLQGDLAQGGNHLIAVLGASLGGPAPLSHNEADDPLLQSVLGTDLLAAGVILPDPSVVQDAIKVQQSRMTGRLPVALQSGVSRNSLYLVPVFRDDMGRETDQPPVLRGVLVGLSDMAVVARQAATTDDGHLAVAVFDLGVGFGDRNGARDRVRDLVWSNNDGFNWQAPPLTTAGTDQSTRVFFAGRTWEIRAVALPEAYGQQEQRAANMIRSLGGIVIAFLVGGIAWLLVSRGDLAEAEVADISMALEHSEARYSRLFRYNRAVEILVDPASGAIVDANEAAASFYGWRRDQLCMMNICDINALNPEEVRAEMNKAQKELRSDFNFRHRLSSGEVRDVEVYSGPIEVDLGDGRGIRSLLYSVIHDVSERRRAERALTASEAHFRVLFEKSPLAIQIINAEGQTIRVNHAWEELWKQSSASVIRGGRTLLNDPQLIENGVADCLRTALTGQMVEIPPFSYALPGLGAHPLWMHAFAYPITGPASARDGNNDLPGDVIIIYDNVTDNFHQQQRLKRTLEDLQRSNEELEQFAYVASHDLQEPLRMVSSYLGLLRKRYGDDMAPDAREFMDFALDGAHHMQELIRDLLDYARVGRVVDENGVIDSRRAVDEARAELAVVIERTGAKISDGWLPQVAVDAGELTRLFVNLLGNALKYHKPDAAPEIHIEARRQGAMWRFSVDDNGIGIDPEHHEKIFKIFQRLHGGGTSGGTGVGLAICRKIVEHNGGQIGVQSQPGSGSSFWFTLPVHNDDGSPASGPENPAAMRATEM
ncbi:ATP-binding protein [Insolitispirillum peregrinum]|uniref:ATP-binding protein n=1 Tax=Insolitispirillum peregrinum TaxID=80876 RepID=UPI003609279A